jgi:hypothetical protein
LIQGQNVSAISTTKLALGAGGAIALPVGGPLAIIPVGVVEALLSGVQSGFRNNNMSDPIWKDVGHGLQVVIAWMYDKYSMNNPYAIYENEVYNSLLAKAADPNDPFHLDVANATQNLNSDYDKFWGIFHSEVKQNMITSSVNSVYDSCRGLMTAKDLNDLTAKNQETFLKL